MSTSLDPDPARRIVGPDRDQNGLQRLSADDTSRQSVNSCHAGYFYVKHFPPIFIPPIVISWKPASFTYKHVLTSRLENSGDPD